MNNVKTLRDKLNGSIPHNEDEEELKRQLEEMHRQADEESKLHDDLIRGDWEVWN